MIRRGRGREGNWVKRGRSEVIGGVMYDSMILGIKVVIVLLDIGISYHCSSVDSVTIKHALLLGIGDIDGD